MGRRGTLRKSRNRLNNLSVMSLGSVTGSIRNNELSLNSLRSYQPLSLELTMSAIELLQTSGLSPNCQETWAQSLIVLPPWVEDSMMQNKDLHDWIQSQTISLAEHPLWKMN
nr:sigma-1s protein [Mammalian orthoreovirus]